MNLQIDPEFQTLVPPLKPEEYALLEQSLVKDGFQTSRGKILSWQGIIVDGYNRYGICQKHDLPFETDDLSFPSREAVKNFIIQTQLGRRNLNVDQYAYLRGKRYETEKKTQGAPVENKNARKNKVVNVTTLNPKTVQKIAKETNVSPKTIQNDATFAKAVDTIAKNAEINPQKLLSGEMKATRKEVQVVAKLPPAKQKQVIAKVTKTKSVRQALQEVNKAEFKETPLMPNGKFSLIYVDPPWSLNDNGSRAAPESGLEYKYPTMTIEQLCAMKVPLEEDAVLFLWVPATMLREALQLIDAWGFIYKTHAVWDKGMIGIGHYFRMQHELLFIATHGNIGTSDVKNQSSILHFPRREHSQKPDEVYAIIEKMYPHQKYLELFARNERKGWTSWGNQIDKNL